MKRRSPKDLEKAMQKNLDPIGQELSARAKETDHLWSASRDSWVHLPVGSIHPDPDQPRKIFDRAKLDELKRAVVALGRLENPIKIFWHPETGRWTIKHGERRHRAISELVADGREELRMVPILIDSAPERTDEGERRLRIEQVVENNARENLLPLETAEQYLQIATAGREKPMPAARLAELTGLQERDVQRHLYVASGLTEEERARLGHEYPDAPLSPLYRLVQWLQEYEAQLSAEQRLAAVVRFTQEKPSANTVRLALKDLTPRKRPGRPARKRFQFGRTSAGGYQVKLTVPPQLLQDAGAIRKAREDLLRAADELETLERSLGAGDE
jgi:ParB/RepB/Spo0J family partition protein